MDFPHDPLPQTEQGWVVLILFQSLLTAPAQSQSILVAQFYEALATNKGMPRSALAALWDLYRLFALFTLEADRYECTSLPPLY